MLSRSGSRLIRRQHSGPPRPDSGHTCSALTVSCKGEKTQNQYQNHYHAGSSPRQAFLLPHHVGVSTARHALAGVEVEEFVDLRGGQSISNLQLLHDEHLPGDGLLTTGEGSCQHWAWALAILPSHCHWIGLVLERHLGDRRDKSGKHVTVCQNVGQGEIELEPIFMKARGAAQFPGDFIEKF